MGLRRTLQMARPTRRDDLSFIYFRARIPADMIPKVKGQRITFRFPASDTEPTEWTSTAALTSHIKVSLRTRDPRQAKALHAVTQGQLQEFLQAIVA